MTAAGKDPLGRIILDYSKDKTDRFITVESDICDDDFIDASYLFRSYNEMPKIEQIALEHCSGDILDIGAGSGIHAKHLQDKGYKVKAIDVSPGAVEYMQSKGIDAEVQDFFEVTEQYDTLLMMMNGIGIAGSLKNLERTLLQAKKMMRENGQLLFDSTDIKYLYMDDDGGMWIDLNTEYYGNFNFKMHYEDQSTDWFEWLYIDFDKLQETANKLNLKVEKLYEEEYQFLARITVN
ncbi:MAG: methyltransferase domain-containing protein [Crocinitomicaceae bacterium]|nr:methyltransferase domain-containing protein [Crocinitomicaceae bacterium]